MNYSAIDCDFMVNDHYGTAGGWGESNLPSSCEATPTRMLEQHL